jgi:hypothetical protein
MITANIPGGGATNGIAVYVGGQIVEYSYASIGTVNVAFPLSFTVNPGESYAIVNSSAATPTIWKWFERN